MVAGPPLATMRVGVPNDRSHFEGVGPLVTDDEPHALIAAVVTRNVSSTGRENLGGIQSYNPTTVRGAFVHTVRHRHVTLVLFDEQETIGSFLSPILLACNQSISAPIEIRLDLSCEVISTLE